MSVSKVVILNKLNPEKTGEIVDMIKDFIEMLSDSMVEVMDYQWLTDLPVIDEACYMVFVGEDILDNDEKVRAIEKIIYEVGKEKFFIVVEEELKEKFEIKLRHLPLYFYPDVLSTRDDFDKLCFLDLVKEAITHEERSEALESIYLASAESEYEKFRLYIKRELERRGYTVLPKSIGKLTSQEEELSIENEEQVFSMMKGCVFSVHFGKQESYDIRGKGVPLKVLENNIAYQLEKALYKHDSSELNDFKRIIWDYHIDTESANDLEYVEKESKKSEYLNSSVDQLKTFLLRLLTEKPIELKKKEEQVNERLKVYFIHKSESTGYVENLSKNLNKAEFEILSPSYKQDFNESRKLHEKALVLCDICIIIDENLEDVEWVNSKVHDQLKASGKRKGAPLVYKALVTKAKKKELEVLLEDDELDILDYDETNFDSVLSFIKEVNLELNV